MAEMEDDEDVGVTAESYGSLNTQDAYDECWLIKIPQKLAQVWDNCPEGTELGELVFRKGGVKLEGNRKVTTKPTLTVQVDTDIIEKQVAPQNGVDPSKSRMADPSPKQPSILN